jgi:UDP-GlcNAc:undecaprenyl-phosphate GlcNAc-1-phosphate transferase
LYFNFKDKIFLGDSGTILLGFLISYFFIKSYNMGSTITSDEIFLIMMIPGFELLRLAIQRLKNKRHPFSADNNHIHHLFLTRLSFFKSYFLVQFLLFFPFLFYLLIANSFISLIVSSTIYSVTILYFSKKK